MRKLMCPGWVQLQQGLQPSLPSLDYRCTGESQCRKVTGQFCYRYTWEWCLTFYVIEILLFQLRNIVRQRRLMRHVLGVRSFWWLAHCTDAWKLADASSKITVSSGVPRMFFTSPIQNARAETGTNYINKFSLQPRQVVGDFMIGTEMHSKFLNIWWHDSWTTWGQRPWIYIHCEY